ncbi:MAG: MFS transporter [Opitutales bacterium]|nr:MFS transporter [Opitutales bacterium]
MKIHHQTLLYDSFRYFFQGALDIEFRTTILLIAIKVFDMPMRYKATLMSVGYLSMLFTPVSLQLMNRSRWNPMQFSAFYFFVIAITLGITVGLQNCLLFCMLTSIARICYKQQIPLMIGVYRNNYTETQRGFCVGIAFACLATGGILFAHWSKNVLAENPNHFEPILLLSAVFSTLCALCFLKIPAQKIFYPQKPSLWANFLLLKRDILFSKILFFWTLIAVATQMTMPLRVEYLASHRQGLDLSAAHVLAILAVTQTVARVLSAPLWGKFYDHVHFVTMRQCVTLCFTIGIPLFFLTDDLRVIQFANILIGIGHGGGGIIWSLWVANIAPKDKVSDYMSADTAIVGLRDGLAIWFGYILLEHTTSYGIVSIVAFGLLLYSLWGFWHLRSAIQMRAQSVA